MADLMMRMAGRGEDGLAKAIRTSDSGELLINNPGKPVIKNRIATDGELVPANSAWTSGVFKSSGYNNLSLQSLLGSNFKYSVEIIEVISNGQATNDVRSTVIIDNADRNVSVDFRMPYDKFRIKIHNIDSQDRYIGIYAYLNNNGRLKLDEGTTVRTLNTLEKRLISESRGNDGNLIPAGGVRRSQVFKTEGYLNLEISAFLATNFPYSIKVVEVISPDTGAATEGNRSTLLIDSATNNKSVRFPIPYQHFRIDTYNEDSQDRSIPIYAYLNNYIEESTTEKSSKIISNEILSTHGTTINAGQKRVLGDFNSGGFNNLEIQTSLSKNSAYKIEVIEKVVRKSSSIFGRRRKLLIRSDGNDHASMSIPYEYFEIQVTNESKNPVSIGVYAYLNNKNTDSEISEKEKAKSSILDAPRLTNIKYLNHPSVKQVNFFHDGLFYGSSKGSKIFTSPDAINWTELHDFSTHEEIAWIIVSDTNRIIVGFKSGKVFVSDEDQVFSDLPTLYTGHLDLRFGQCKYENVILFNVYSLQKGVQGSGKHEVWLSKNNGETFEKIFDNSTPAKVLPISTDSDFHLHDVEYDPYAGRIYLWNGDFDERLLQYSDDWGKTWHPVSARGLMSNSTQTIATPTGIVLGADTERGGVGFISLDRRRNISEVPKYSNYTPDHWIFTEKPVRYVAGRRWVERENDLYLMPFIPEYTDSDSGFITYSRDGENWSILHKSIGTGSYLGFQNVVHGNGIIAATHLREGAVGEIFSAKLI